MLLCVARRHPQARRGGHYGERYALVHDTTRALDAHVSRQLRDWGLIAELVAMVATVSLRGVSEVLYALALEGSSIAVAAIIGGLPHLGMYALQSLLVGRWEGTASIAKRGAKLKGDERCVCVRCAANP